MSALDDKNVSVRVQAARALGEIGSEASDAVKGLGNLLHAAEKEAATEAANALAKIGKASVPTLTTALKSDAAHLRLLAVGALAKVGGDAVPVIVDALGSPYPDVRRQAAQVLGPMRISDKMVVLGLAYALKDDDKQVRLNAVSALQQIGAGAGLAAPALLNAVNDSDANVRQQAIYALNQVRGEPDVMVPALAKFLKDPSSSIRQNIVNVLAGYGAPAVPHLIDALKDSEPQVRYGAVSALQRSGGDLKDALPALLPMLKEGSNFQKRNVILVLGRIGEPAVPHLLTALKNPDQVIRGAAVQAFRTVGAAGEKAVPELVTIALKDPAVQVRQQTAYALIAMGPNACGKYLDAIKDMKDDATRQTALQALSFSGTPTKVAVPFLISTLKEGTVNHRSMAARVLGNIGAEAKEAIPALEAVRNDPNAAVRTNVEAALKKIKGS
jgi:HEAT repeat protein